MALPVVDSTPTNGSVVQPGADHKSFNVRALAAEAKARFGDNPTQSTTPAATPAPIPPPTAPASSAPTQDAQARTSPTSREYLTPSQAAQETIIGPPAAGVLSQQPQHEQVVQGADAAKTPEQQILEIPDDAYVRVPVNGELKLMKGVDAKRQMMLHADYTRKTQELARQRQAYEPLVRAAGGDPRRVQELLSAADEAPKLRTLLSDPEYLERYLRTVNHPVLSRLAQSAQHTGHLPQPGQQPQSQPQTNPDELTSFGDVDRVVGAKVSAFDQKVAEAVAKIQAVEDGVAKVVDQKLQHLENSRHAIRIKGQLADVISTAVKENPVLSVIPNLTNDVVREVKAMGPRNEQETFQATSIVLQAFVENAHSIFENHYQKQALAKKEILTQGIEPPTGTSVSIQPPTSFVDPRTGKFSFDNMRRAAKGYSRT